MRRIWSLRPFKTVVITYAVATVALWPIPLFNVLHAESAAVLAVVAFFAAGISSIALFGGGLSARRVLAIEVMALAVPLTLMTVVLPWIPNCSYPVGLMFFGLFPMVSAILATSMAYLFTGLEIRHPRSALIIAGVAIALVTPLYDLGLHPQLYTYNHVFGGVLGPIYDEELAIRPGLFAFRGLTLMWAALALLAGTILRRRVGPTSTLCASAVALSVSVIVAYVYSDRLGWNTTHRQLQAALEDHMASERYEIYYDAASFLPGELEQLTSEMEYRYHSISAALEEHVSQSILVYLYPTAALKGSLTGSRYTSVTPVWLRRPQVHMLARRADDSFDHELVHVFSREFGMPIIHASLAVGLVEGVASALEAPTGDPSPGDLMAATVMTGATDSAAVIGELVASLNAFGFWTGRGAVSYAETGSFVDYLLRRYGPQPLKVAYRTASFRRAYGVGVEELATEWYDDLRTVHFSPAALPTARRVFAVPSLFESECPHTVPGYVRAYREAADHMAVHDTSGAIRALRASIDGDPGYLPAVLTLAATLVREGNLDDAAKMLPRDSVSLSYPSAAVLSADLHALAGEHDKALGLYQQAMDSLPIFSEEARATVLIRKHVSQWPEALGWLIDISGAGSEPPAFAADAAGPAYALVGFTRRREFRTACQAGQGPADYLAAGFSTIEAALLKRQKLSWLGEACENGGLLEEARAAYRRAEAAYGSSGNVDMKRLAQDRLRRVGWKLSKETGRTKPSSFSATIKEAID